MCHLTDFERCDDDDDVVVDDDDDIFSSTSNYLQDLVRSKICTIIIITKK